MPKLLPDGGQRTRKKSNSSSRSSASASDRRRCRRSPNNPPNYRRKRSASRSLSPGPSNELSAKGKLSKTKDDRQRRGERSKTPPRKSNDVRHSTSRANVRRRHPRHNSRHDRLTKVDVKDDGAPRRHRNRENDGRSIQESCNDRRSGQKTHGDVVKNHQTSDDVRNGDERSSRRHKHVHTDDRQLNKKKCPSPVHTAEVRVSPVEKMKEPEGPGVNNSPSKDKKKHRYHYRCHKHRKHHKHHSRKRHSTTKGPDVGEDGLSRSHPSPIPSGPSKRILHHNYTTEIIPLDSKEIYADGDKIIVNVNFSKRPPAKDDENLVDLSDVKNPPDNPEDTKDDTSMDKDGDSVENTSSKPGEPRKDNLKLKSKSRTEFDIFWEEDSNDNKGKKNESASRDDTGKSKPSEKGASGLRFLPRTLLNESKVATNLLQAMPSSSSTRSATQGPRTPVEQNETEGVDDDENKSQKEENNCDNETGNNISNMYPPSDQTMATPTQDESNLDDTGIAEGISNNLEESKEKEVIKSPSSPPSATANLKPNASLEIYDPEAPLESPSENETNEPLSSSNHSKTLSNNQSKSPEVKKSPVLSPSQKNTSPPSPKVPVCFSSSQIVSNSVKSASVNATHQSTLNCTNLTNSVATVSSNQVKLPSLNSVKPVNSSHQVKLATTSSTSLKSSVTSTKQGQNSISRVPSHQQLAQILQTASSILNSSGSKSVLNSCMKPTLSSVRSSANKDVNEVIDMDVESPYSPPSPTSHSSQNRSSAKSSSLTVSSVPASQSAVSKSSTVTGSTMQLQSVIDQLLRAASKVQQNAGTASTSSSVFKRPHPISSSSISDGSKKIKPESHHPRSHHHQTLKFQSLRTKSGDKILTNASASGQKPTEEDVPSSAVEMQVKEKYLKKLNRQERVVEEVKVVLKPFYQKRDITKEEYKEVMRKSVPKICHSKTGEINPVKIRQLIEGYIKKLKHSRRKSKTSGVKKNILGPISLSMSLTGSSSSKL